MQYLPDFYNLPKEAVPERRPLGDLLPRWKGLGENGTDRQTRSPEPGDQAVLVGRPYHASGLRGRDEVRRLNLGEFQE